MICNGQPPEKKNSSNKKKPGNYAGFAVSSPTAYPIYCKESDYIWVLGHSVWTNNF
jgi:hypothetical protein